MTRLRAHCHRRHRQCGVYAVEYALVFMVFFALVYACICYALLFTFRFALQTAAEEGARAGLKVQTIASAASQIENRQLIASRVASARVEGWLPAALQPPDIVVCVRKNNEDGCASTPSDCAQLNAACQITVRVQVSGVRAMLPQLIPLPDSLTGQASLQLDRRTL